MKSLYRSSLLVALVALFTAARPLEAQLRQKELRIDLAGLSKTGPVTDIFLGFPGAVAFGLYINKNVAIEPQFIFASQSGNGPSTSFTAMGVAVPYYFTGDFGKTGFFVSPGLMITKPSGGNTNLDFGADAGLKKSIRDGLSMRGAVTLRSGDSYPNDPEIGLTFGLSLFWK